MGIGKTQEVGPTILSQGNEQHMRSFKKLSPWDKKGFWTHKKKSIKIKFRRWRICKLPEEVEPYNVLKILQ